MAGLVKAKKFLWKDTNLEFFGSDSEKQVSIESVIVIKLYRRDGSGFTWELRSMLVLGLPNLFEPSSRTQMSYFLSLIETFWRRGACTEIIYFCRTPTRPEKTLARYFRPPACFNNTYVNHQLICVCSLRNGSYNWRLPLPVVNFL